MTDHPDERDTFAKVLASLETTMEAITTHTRVLDENIRGARTIPQPPVIEHMPGVPIILTTFQRLTAVRAAAQAAEATLKAIAQEV